MVFVLEIIGTIAFAVSGALVAAEKKMDLLGVIILGMTTAVGGGIVRDIILGITPPVAFTEPIFALLSIGVSVVCFFKPVRNLIGKTQVFLLVMESLGLGMFTVIGVQAAMPFKNYFLAIFLGTLTGVGGGVLRDLFAGNKPYIFVKHVYATSSILGAATCAVIWRFSNVAALIAGFALTFTLRILAAIFKWNLPKA